MTTSARRPRTGVTYAYTVLAWIFVACIAVQVLLAGLAVFDSATYWQWHVIFVHFFEWLPVILFILALVGRLPKWITWLTVVEMAQLILQHALISIGDIPAAFHPLNGMVLFFVAILLAFCSGRYARKTTAPMTTHTTRGLQ